MKIETRFDSTTLTDAFLTTLAFQGRSAGTRVKYGQVIRGFESWLGESRPGDLNVTDIEDYFAVWMAQFETRYGRSPKANTLRNQVTAVRSFYEYLDHRDLLVNESGEIMRNPMDKIAIPKAETTPNDFLSGAEDAALITGAWTLPDRVVITLLRLTGIRVGEARNLKISDLHISGNNRLIVTKSKSEAGLRTVPLSPELLPILYSWFDDLTRRGLFSLKTPVLVTGNGTPMQTSYIDRVVKRVAYRAGVRQISCTCGSSTSSSHQTGCARTRSGHKLSEVTCHTLRRTFATDLRNKGVAIDSISKLLGHSSTAQTEKYYAQLLDPTIKQDLHDKMGWAS